MNQELIPSGMTKAVFRPIDLDLSCGSNDEPTATLQSRSKSIFRLPNDEIHSPHSVARANPIQDEQMRETEGFHDRVISPYPYSPSPEELEERSHLMLGMDWRESVPFEPRLEQESKNTNEDTGKTLDFSFYFENVPADMQDVASDVDDVSFISYDEESLEDAGGFCLEPVSTSIWDTVLSPSRQKDDSKQFESRFSPAQVSLGSDSEQGRSPSPLALEK